jgi:putative flippase GtrA
MPWSTVIQFGKFLIVGTLNTAIDFGTLNLLSSLTGIYGGVRLAPINVPGVLFALTNSYLLNKYWTFKAPVHLGRRVGRFVLVSLLGAGLNTACVVALTHVVMRPSGLTPQLWENLAKVLATGGTLLWNFFGYKFLVFHTPPAPERGDSGSLAWLGWHEAVVHPTRRSGLSGGSHQKQR